MDEVIRPPFGDDDILAEARKRLNGSARAFVTYHAMDDGRSRWQLTVEGPSVHGPFSWSWEPTEDSYGTDFKAFAQVMAARLPVELRRR